METLFLLQRGYDQVEIRAVETGLNDILFPDVESGGNVPGYAAR